jgi:hypothetical protein
MYTTPENFNQERRKHRTTVPQKAKNWLAGDSIHFRGEYCFTTMVNFSYFAQETKPREEQLK